VLVSPGAPAAAAGQEYGLYARVSSRDQKAGLDRLVARLAAWVADAGGRVVRIEAEVRSGVDGARAKVGGWPARP